MKNNILMIGALSIQYIRDNWVVPMRKLFNTTFVDVSPILSFYRNTDYIEQYIFSILRRQRFDYMFFYSDAINPDFSDDFFKTIRKAGIPIVNFLADDEPEIWFQQNLPYDHRFDLIATHSKRGYQRRIEMGKADQFIYIPWGFSNELFDRIPDTMQIYDVIYIGSNLCQDHDPNLYYGGGFQRQKLLVEVFNFCRHQGLIFKVFGAGWHRHPILNQCNGGLLSDEDMVKIYSETKIVLNPGFSADDHEFSSYQSKLRHFEVAGCGAFQLVNSNPELAELFKPDEDIVYFDNIQDLKDKIIFYIQNELHRQQIADSIYKKRHLHTTESRLIKLFNEANKRFPLQQKTKKPGQRTPKVKTLIFKNPKEAQEQLQQLNAKSEALSGYEALHIITGDFYVHPIEYSTWKTNLKPKELPITGIRTYLQLASLYVNPIQRKKQNMLGIILKEKIEKKSLNPWLLEYLKEQCLLLGDDYYLYPLMNLIIPLHQVETVLHCYLEKNFALFEALHKENSGWVINDLELKPGILPEELAHPPYILKLEKLLKEIRGKNERIMIYGAKGNMTDHVLKLFSKFPDLNIIGFIDRTMAGQKVKDLPVYRFEEIERLKPSIIIIAAETSGFAIYENIKHIQINITLLPLHDLTHSIWEVLT